MANYKARSPTREKRIELELRFAETEFNREQNPLIALGAFQFCIEQDAKPPAWLMEAIQDLAIRGVRRRKFQWLENRQNDLKVVIARSRAEHRTDLQGDIYEKTSDVLRDEFGIEKDPETVKKACERYKKTFGEDGSALYSLWRSPLPDDDR